VAAPLDLDALLVAVVARERARPRRPLARFPASTTITRFLADPASTPILTLR